MQIGDLTAEQICNQASVVDRLLIVLQTMSEITQRLTTALAGRYRIDRELGGGGMWRALAQSGKRQSRGALCPPTSLRSEIVTQLRKLKSQLTATVTKNQQSGGVGGGIRTHKGLRPTACETVAFTDFATPAPFSAAKPSKSEDQDARLHSVAEPHDQCVGCRAENRYQNCA